MFIRCQNTPWQFIRLSVIRDFPLESYHGNNRVILHLDDREINSRIALAKYFTGNVLLQKLSQVQHFSMFAFQLRRCSGVTVINKEAAHVNLNQR